MGAEKKGQEAETRKGGCGDVEALGDGPRTDTVFIPSLFFCNWCFRLIYFRIASVVTIVPKYHSARLRLRRVGTPDLPTASQVLASFAYQEVPGKLNVTSWRLRSV